MKSAEYWIQHLQLMPHTEGGFFRETYRSNIPIPMDKLPRGFSEERKIVTSIYYLLRSEDVSKMHRLKSDEIWYFHCGSTMRIHMIDTEGNKHTFYLGDNYEKAESFSLLIPAGNIFCAEIVKNDSYCLVSCVVAPGFDYKDYEIFEQEDLLQAYPKHTDLITRFT